MRRNLKRLIPPDSLAVFAAIGAALKRARVARNFTLDAAAGRSGVSRASIARMERGDPSVAFGAYGAYLHLLGLFSQVAEACEPAQDALGEHLRAQQVRQRPRSPPAGKAADTAARYDF